MANTSGAGAERNGGSSANRTGTVTSPLSRFPQMNLMFLLTLGLLAQGLFALAGPGLAAAKDKDQDSEKTKAPATFFEVKEAPAAKANRDSLMTEIQDYTRMIRSLRDSLSAGDTGQGLQLSPAQREKLEGSITDISQVIERISSEMAEMEFEIKDNRISLVNEAGEGIVINVPEDLDERMSEGIEAITKVILSELPDSVDFDHSRKWDWNRFRPEPPAPKRRIINGNIVKVWDDVQISAKEDVRGNVVVVFGSAEISGRVDGNVVTVFGNLLVNETAEITGTVVAAGGYLDQDPAAQVDDVVSIDPLKMGGGEGWSGLFSHDGVSFLISQGTFLLTVLMAVIAAAVTPRRRFEAITDQLQRGALPSLGTGLLVATGGHLVIAVLMAVLVLTVIGVPLALLVGMAMLIVAVVSVAVCGAVVGSRICRLLGGRCGAPWLVVVAGMVALHLASFTGSLLGALGAGGVAASLLVGLGLAIKMTAYFLGLGALVLSRFGRKPASA